MAAPTTALERADIQGLLFSAYSHLPFAAFLLLHIDNVALARQWLGTITGRITDSRGKQDERSLNVGVTHDGLVTLGVDKDALSTFSFPFQEGLVAPHRSRSLGDVDANDPAGWAWGTDGAVDFLLLAYSRTRDDRDHWILDLQKEAAASGMRCLKVFPTDAPPGDREHFGFRDGIGQPVIAGTGNDKRQKARTGHETTLPPGEFLLGHTNLYRLRSGSPTVDGATDRDNVLIKAPASAGQATPRHDLGYNGSYLIFRQLEQNVPKFWNDMERQSRALGMEGPNAARELAAKCVGRWPSGAPLVLAPLRDDPALTTANDFMYDGPDPNGFRCPIGAHIRRANPRDMNGMDPSTQLPLASLHRIMRRGRSYGPWIADSKEPDEVPRGLHFICVNADIERQFEMVQQTWISNPVFGGLTGEVDPLVGNQATAGGYFSIPNTPVRRRVVLQTFVTVRGGSYFFVPSFRALHYLSSLRPW